jgi:hypothetical protein
VETALHQLVVPVEKALEQQETALGVFLDIEGAFNNTCYETTCDALVRHGDDYTIVRKIRATLKGRVAVATLNGSSMRVAISRVCRQVVVLSPLLWCLVMDNLLARHSGNGVYIQRYADDMSSCGKQIPKHGIRAHAVGPSNHRDMVQQSWTVG